MRSFFNPLTGDTFTPSRLMWDRGGDEPGPLTVLMCGVHGNEPSGWLALDAVGQTLTVSRGRVIAVCANLAAVEAGVRYVERDMNRLWGRPDDTPDGRELAAVTELLEPLLDHDGPKHFLDCHSVSGESVPFLSVLGEPACAAFAERLPAHAVLGAGDHLPGVSDRWLFERGFVGCTSEAGRHEELATAEAQEALVWSALSAAGNVSEETAEVRRSQARLWRLLLDGRRNFEVRHVHQITADAEFIMRPGYFNFRPVREGETLAVEAGEEVRSPCGGRVYMPLYQPQGAVGFSIVREIGAG